MSNDEMEVDEPEAGRVIEGIYIPPPPKRLNYQHKQGPRLIISKIESTFFKSFAQTTIVGPFHKCFSSIIGPNGSGKSNVIDSMLFVFGYRASSIRCKKLSLLLHNSSQYTHIQTCQVVVHFEQILDNANNIDDNNSIDFQVIPDSHFTIGRTAHRDNSSYYTINGKTVQFKEVANLLRYHGIDIDHNRFLILQGEVEQISLMKPKSPDGKETGFLEYLEDVIGSDRLKEPILHFEENINQLTEQKLEFLNRIRVAEIELESLKKPRNEALQYVNDENEIIMMKNVLFQKYIFLNKDILEQVSENINELDEKKSIIVEKLEEIINAKTKINEEFDSINIIYKKILEKSNQLYEKYNELNKMDQEIENDILHIKKKSKKNKEDLKKQNNKLEELKLSTEKNEKFIKDIEKALEKKKPHLEEKEKYLSEVMASLNDEETQRLQKEREKLQVDLAPLQERVNKAKNAYEEATKQLLLMSSGFDQENAELKKLENKQQQTEESTKNQEKSFSETNMKFKKIKPEIEQTKIKLTELKEREEKVSLEIQELTSDLEEIRVSLSSNISQNTIVSNLMQAQSEKLFNGFLGRLGDLGGIDKKYDIAISTCCGALDNLVVETVHCAEKCISYLHKHSLGRATFIVLEKQEYLRPIYMKKIKFPDYSHRLFDLVKVEDERILPAFYYALRDTLVVDNLEEARRVAYNGQTRFRVVTLNGHLIEMAGTMSGGGKKQLSGRIGEKVKSISRKSFSKDQISSKEHQLENLKVQFNEIRMQRNVLEKNLTNLLNEEKMSSSALQKFNTEMKSLAQQAKQLENRLEEQRKKVKACRPDPKQIANLQNIVDQNQLLKEQAEKEAQKLEVCVQRVHEEVLQRTEGRVKKARESRDEIRKNIKKLEQEQTKCTVGITTAARNLKTAQKNIENLERENEQYKKDFENLREKQKLIEVEASELMKNKEKKTNKLMEYEVQLEELKLKMNPLNKKENELKSSQIDFNQKYEGYKEKLESTKKKIKDLEKQLNSLEFKMYSGCKKFKMKVLIEEELNKIDAKALQYKLAMLENELSKKTLNLKILDEYEIKRDEYKKRTLELEELTIRLQHLKTIHIDLKNQREREFREGFAIISHKMKEIYRLISFGGDAELELVDMLNPFEEGIEFTVRPPKKSWKNIVNLSGGEKTLSSLALIFSLHHYKASPVFFMDEIDAALDPRNVSIVANYVRHCATNTQFIIISHRQNMFDLADRLISIYKTYESTKTVALNPKIYLKDKTLPSNKNTQENQNN